MRSAKLVAALSVVILAAGCSATAALPAPKDTAGFPTPKDTVVLNNYAPAVAACESLFGNPNDIAKAYGLATSASALSWASAQGSTDDPLICMIDSIDSPPMPSVYVAVENPSATSCSDTETCGEPVAGFYVTVWTGLISGTTKVVMPSDPEATKKWLTEVAKHVK